MHFVLIRTNNWQGNPFTESEGRGVEVARNQEGVIWVNWTVCPKFSYLGCMTYEESKFYVNNDPNILSRTTGDLPKKIVDLFNLKY